MPDETPSLPTPPGDTQTRATNVSQPAGIESRSTLRAEACSFPSGDDAVAALPNVPGYAIEGVLGKGGMGIVYMARHVGLKRVVALKMLASERASPSQRARFRAETEAVARLQHPNVVQVFEVGETSAGPYCALEFAAGGSLAQRVREATLSPIAGARIVEQITRAMEAAHQAGVIHRDLKPANVLLSNTAPDPHAWQPKVTDFGLAKLIDDPDSGVTQAGQVLGTPSYMAPEQAFGRTQDVTIAADVYALGAILYELITGRPPFKGASTSDTLAQVRTQEPVPPTRLQPNIPRDLEAVCLRCLEKEPQRRYRSAAELADDLKRFIDGKPTMARPVRAITRAVKWVRRNPVVAGLLLLAGASLAGGTIATYSQYREARRERDIARKSGEAAERAAGKERHATYRSQFGRARLLAEARKWQDALDALDECRWDLRGWEWRQLRRQCSVQTISNEVLPFGSTWFSFDGKQVAFTVPGRMADRAFAWSIVIRDLARRMPDRRLDTPPGSTPMSVSFDAKGQRLAALFRNSLLNAGWEVRVWNDNDAMPACALIGPAPELATAAQLSPDGRHLAIVVNKEGGAILPNVAELRVFAVDGNKELFRTPVQANSNIAFAPDHAGIAVAADNNGITLLDLNGRKTGHFPLGGAEARDLAFSPDGALLAVAPFRSSFKGAPQLVPELGQGIIGAAQPVVLNLRTGQTYPLSMPGLGDLGCGNLRFSPDGLRLAGSDQMTREVGVWDVQSVRAGEASTPPLIMSIASPVGPGVVGFSADARNLLLLDSFHGVRAWEFSSDTGIVAFEGQQARFVADGRILVGSASWQNAQKRMLGRATVYDRWGGPPRLELGAGTVIPSPDGQTYAAIPSNPGDPFVVFNNTGKESLRVEIPREAAFCRAAYSDDSRWLAVSSSNNVHVYDVQTGAKAQTLLGHQGPVNGICFHPAGKLLATVADVVSGNSTRGELIIWDFAAGQQLHVLAVEAGFPNPAPYSHLTNIGPWFTADGRHLVATFQANGSIQEPGVSATFHYVVGKKEAEPAPPVTFPKPVGRARTAVRIWDAATFAERLTVPLYPTNGAMAPAIPGLGPDVHFAADGRYMVARGDTMFNHEIAVWDLHHASAVATLPIANAHVALSPDGRRLAAATNRSVRILDVASGQELLSLTAPSSVSRLAFSPDGHALAAQIVNRMILWDARPVQGEWRIRISGRGFCRGVDFSADGTRVVARVAKLPDPGPMPAQLIPLTDDFAKSWDVNSGVEVTPCTDPMPSANQNVADSPDGRWQAVVDKTGVELRPNGALEVEQAGREEGIWRARQWHQKQAASAAARGEAFKFPADFHRARLQELLKGK